MKTFFARSSKDGRRSASATRDSLRRNAGWRVELVRGTRHTTSKRTVVAVNLADAHKIVREFIAA